MNLPTSNPFMSTPVKTVLFEDAASHDANVEADVTNNSLKITVQGFSTGGTYRWVATVRTAEVSIP